MLSSHISGRYLLNTLVIAVSLWLLLPTTLLFSIGLFASIGGIYQHQQFNVTWVFVTAILLLPGAGLGAVWWLTVAFPFIKGISAIPRIVLAGMLISIAFAIIVFAANHAHLANKATSVFGVKDTLLGMSGFGGGPFLAAILLIVGIWFRQRFT